MEVVRLPDLLGKDNIFVSMTDAMDYAQVRRELLSSRPMLHAQGVYVLQVAGAEIDGGTDACAAATASSCAQHRLAEMGLAADLVSLPQASDAKISQAFQALAPISHESSDTASGGSPRPGYTQRN